MSFLLGLTAYLLIPDLHSSECKGFVYIGAKVSLRFDEFIENPNLIFTLSSDEDQGRIAFTSASVQYKLTLMSQLVRRYKR